MDGVSQEEQEVLEGLLAGDPGACRRSGGAGRGCSAAGGCSLRRTSEAGLGTDIGGGAGLTRRMLRPMSVMRGI